MTWSWFSFLVGAPLWGSVAVLLYGSASAVKAIRNRADEIETPRFEPPAPLRAQPRAPAVQGVTTFEPYLPQITRREGSAQILR